MVLLFLIFMQTGIRRKDVSGCPARELKERMPAGTGVGVQREKANGCPAREQGRNLPCR